MVRENLGTPCLDRNRHGSGVLALC